MFIYVHYIHAYLFIYFISLQLFDKKYCTIDAQNLCSDILKEMQHELQITMNRLFDTSEQKNSIVIETFPSLKVVSTNASEKKLAENTDMNSKTEASPALPNVEELHLRESAMTCMRLRENWPKLRTIEKLLKMMEYEALFIQPLQDSFPEQWLGFLAAIKDFLMKLSALQSVLPQGVRLFTTETILSLWKYNITLFKDDALEMLKFLENLSTYVHHRNRQLSCSGVELPEFTPFTRKPNQKSLVRAAYIQSLQEYWSEVLSKDSADPTPSHIEVHSLLTAGVMWRALVESIERLNVAAVALNLVYVQQPMYSFTILGCNLLAWLKIIISPFLIWREQVCLGRSHLYLNFF